MDTLKNRKTLLLIALLITSLLLTLPIHNSLAAQDNPGTIVGGTLTENTTWTAQNSPYIVNQTIIVPADVYLTIQPDVTVTIQSSDTVMFQINGVIKAGGNATDKIVFDGGGNANFFRTNHPVVAGFLSLNYCTIRNGLSAFWFDNTAYLNMTNCDLSNLSQYSYLWYPSQDVHLEYNTFTNCSGIKIGTDDYSSNSSGMVYVKYNLFVNNQGFIINNYASYGQSKINVNFNSFSATSGIVLEVEQTSTTADMDASQNFWGTANTTTIDSMIYDSTDDASCASRINYLPILDAPDPEVPVAPTPTPSPSPSPTAIPEPSASPSTSPNPSTTPLPSTEPMVTPTPSTPPNNSPTPQPTVNPTNADTSTPDSTLNPNSSDASSLEQPSASTNPQSIPTLQSNPTSSPPVFDASKNYIQIIAIVALVVVAVGLTVAFVKRKW